MSSGSTLNYFLPYPLSTDPVNVASDIQSLATSLDTFFVNPAFINSININGGSVVTSALTANLFNTNATTLNIGSAATAINIGNASGQTNFAGHVNIATGKEYEINNVSILSATTLGSSVLTSSLTTVGTIATGTWNATTIAVNKGGTGLTSYAIGDIVYASGATTLAKLADVATGNALISGGVGVAPSWGKIALTTHISGTLPVANGGTGVTTSTGTGNVVLSTSPTLTTPSIGVATGTSFNSITGLSSTTPVMNGTAAVGISTTVARADHVHGTDTTRAPIASPTFTGIVSSQGTQILMNSDVTGSPSENILLSVERGTSPDVAIRWNESTDVWEFTNDGTTYQSIGSGGGAGIDLSEVYSAAMFVAGM